MYFYGMKDGSYMKYLSIRVKILMLTLVILIPLIILQAINIYENYQKKTEQKLQTNVELAEAVSKSFTNYIEELWIRESFISDHIIDNINDPKEIQSHLESIVSVDKNALERLSWISPSGIIIANSRKYMIGQSVTERDYYKKIIAGKEEVLSDLVISYVDGKLVIPVVRGAKKDGKLLGILSFPIDANNLFSHIPNLKLNDGETLRLIDSSGNIVYDSSNNNLPFKERKILSDDSGWKALKGEIVKTHNDRVDFDSDCYMSVDYPISEIGWACSITSKKSTVLNDIYVQAVQSIITLILVSVISLIASYILGKKITEPLVILKNKANQLKLGDYSIRTNIPGYDEVASTAQAFDLMADSIEQYDKLKSQFFSNLSHEFKTPINVIYSSVQLIESFQSTLDDKEFKNKTLKNIKVLRQNCYRLMKIVDNTIDVTRYDTGHFKMNPYKADIISVIENICLSVAKYTEQKGVTIIFDTEVEEKIIYCDPYMIERIVLNLISNSLKFTDASGFIYVNVYDREDKVIFSIRDTGIGIPEDKLSIIFDRFRQVDTSLNRNHEGSGLGLSIVRALVEAHKGNISVNSKLGMGTEFVIELPANVFYENGNENNKSLFNNDSHTIQKIEIEFSDIYSINKSFLD
jgi:signal transduction histidine kinase